MGAACIGGSPSLSLKLTFALAAFSLSSFTLSSPSTRTYLSFFPSKSPPRSSLSSSFSSQNVATDILSLLGSRQQASAVPVNEADEIRSCLRFLVPFEKLPEAPQRELLLFEGGAEEREKDEIVRWPPPPVLELARLAVDSGGDPAAIHQSLDPTVLKVPDVDGLAKDKCQLTRTPSAYRFANKDLNAYFAFLFELISARAPLAGFNVSLSRYDLFHGHLFLAPDTGRLGMLPN